MYIKKTLPKIIPVVILLGFIFQAIVPSAAGISSDTLSDTPSATVSGSSLAYNMSYVYFGSSGSYTENVNRSRDSLNEISPNYFNLNKDGSLALTNALDKVFIDEMHSRGILVVPFLSNHWDRELGRAALSKKVELADQLAKAIEQYNLDGINVDLENLTDVDRDEYTDFIRLLRESLGDKKILSVSVAANPYGILSGWKGSYDYEKLGAYSDYLMIMAYDEHYSGGSPGPVSSLSFSEKSIQYAISKVAKEKILLGIPFYGRIWKKGEGFPQGAGIGNVEAEALIEEYSGTVKFDKESSTPYGTFTIKEKDKKPKINGGALGAGTYTIWFENEPSIKSKLELVGKYNIKGTGSWSLGQETDATWDYYKLWLNGCYFKDVGNHWAKNYILNAYKKNWVMGLSPTTFGPDNYLTRGEGVAILVRLLKLPVESEGAQAFNDTKDHWALAEINTAKSYNIVNGGGGGEFYPEAPITREEMAVMLDKVLNNSSVYGKGRGPEFSDISKKSNSWSMESIDRVSKLGVIKGFPDGTFRPKDKLTRGQMVVIINELEKAID